MPTHPAIPQGFNCSFIGVFPLPPNWLIELGELDATFKKSDIAQLKAFIPANRDIIRRPFARKESYYGRRTVFFGSVNKKEFLADDTGNTRFWTIKVTAINYNHTIDMQQVWAEIYQLYESGEPFMMGADEMETVNRNNEEFMSADYHDELAARRFDWSELPFIGQWKTTTEICHDVGIIHPKQNDLNKMGRAIRNHNGDQDKRGTGGVRLLYVPKLKLGNHDE